MGSKESKISTSIAGDGEIQSESSNTKTQPSEKKSEVTENESATDKGQEYSLVVRDQPPSNKESSQAKENEDGSVVKINKQETSQPAISADTLKHDLQDVSSECIENKDSDGTNKQEDNPLKIGIIDIQEKFQKFLKEKELEIPETKSPTTKNEIDKKEIEKENVFEPKGKRADHENETEDEKNDDEKVEENEAAINVEDIEGMVSSSPTTIKAEGSSENEIAPVFSKKEFSKMTVAERLKKFWGTNESEVPQIVSSQTMEDKEFESEEKMAGSENEGETEEENDNEEDGENEQDSDENERVEKDSSSIGQANTEGSTEKEISPSSSEKERSQKTFPERLKLFFESNKSDASETVSSQASHVENKESESEEKMAGSENEDETTEEIKDKEENWENEPGRDKNERVEKYSFYKAPANTEGTTEKEISPAANEKESSQKTFLERLKLFFGTTKSDAPEKFSSQTMEEKEFESEEKMASSENADETKEERNDKEEDGENEPDSEDNERVEKDSSSKVPANTEGSTEKKISPASFEKESTRKTFPERLKWFFGTTKSYAPEKTWMKDDVSTIGSEVTMQTIETYSTIPSIITSESSKTLSSHLSGSKSKIDDSTLSSCIESSEKVTPELAVNEDGAESSEKDIEELQETESDKEESRRQSDGESQNTDEDSDQKLRDQKAVLPSISSTSVVIEPEEIGTAECTKDESEKAEDPFSVFLNALQKHEMRRLTEEELEPLGHQDFQITIDKTNEDIQGHFSKASIKRKKAKLLRKSSMIASPKPSTRFSRMSPPESESKTDVSPSKATISRLSPTTDEKTCEWEPGKFEPRVGYYYRLQSWVGDYIQGYDYWSKKQGDVRLHHVEEVRFNIDDHSAWYDQNMSKTKISKSALDKRRDVTMKKIEALKVKAPESVQKGGKQLPIAYDPKEPVAEELKQDLKNMFMEFARNDPSPAKNRMSLKNVDKWLERVGLLDHQNLTLVHTGLCFIAAGGNRYHGLTFEEFFTFVEMISDTLNKPIKHCINRLKYAVLDLSMADRMK